MTETSVPIGVATERLIDSVWTVRYIVIDHISCIILQYSRNIKEGYDREKSIDKCRIIEDENRNAIELQIIDRNTEQGNTYKICNSRNIFDYNCHNESI